jgi:hypothetical protein
MAVHDERALLALQGPAAFEVLQPLVKEDLTKLYFSNFTRVNISGFPCWITRTGYSPSSLCCFPMHAARWWSVCPLDAVPAAACLAVAPATAVRSMLHSVSGLQAPADTVVCCSGRDTRPASYGASHCAAPRTCKHQLWTILHDKLDHSVVSSRSLHVPCILCTLLRAPCSEHSWRAAAVLHHLMLVLEGLSATRPSGSTYCVALKHLAPRHAPQGAPHLAMRWCRVASGLSPTAGHCQPRWCTRQ